ncbi:HD-GYP hydrolase domain-containing protein [Candidatus Magnetoovum chiemensis]|nr:HD-GYP hydrolase domain-containing protein [Candidatus Magnetoovum chiemensis]
MKKKIPIKDLTVGMYVEGIAESWLKTPFLNHRFFVKNDKQIQMIKDMGLEYLYIDTEKGADTSSVSDSYDDINDAYKELEKIPFLSKSDILIETTDQVDMDQLIYLKKEESFVKKAAKYTEGELNKYYSSLESYTQIDKKILKQGDFIDFSLYLKNSLLIEPYIEYRNRSIEVTDSIINIEGEFLIKRTENEKYRSFLNNLLNSRIYKSSELKKETENIVLREKLKLQIEKLLDNPRNEEQMRECKETVYEILTYIYNNKTSILDLIAAERQDYYTYIHCANVLILSVGLGLAMGMNKEEELYHLALGAMLHDIGNSQVPLTILNKPSRLSDNEYALMKKHVLIGKRILREHKTLSQEIYYPLMEHHEKSTGRGYPSGLTAKDMHLCGKIAALTDSYEALTTGRPFKTPLKSFEALSIIKDQLNDYSPDIFFKFVKMLG